MSRALRVTCVVSVLIELGCSESRQTVLASQTDTCTTACDGGTPVDSGAIPETQIALGQCFGEGVDCESEVDVIPYEAGPVVQCDPTYRGQGAIVWTSTLGDLACPDLCWVQYAKIDFAPDGNLDVLGNLRFSNPYGRGLWSGRIDSSGALIESSALEVWVGSNLSVTRGFQPLGTDPRGNRFAFGIARDEGITELYDIEVLRYDRAGNPSTVLDRVAGTVYPELALAPDGGFALKVQWTEQTQDPYADAVKRVDVARYDATGRLLWNQTKLSRLLVLNEALLIGIDAGGNVAVRVGRATHRAVNNREYIRLYTRFARIDSEGNVVSAWDAPDPDISSSGTAAVAPDGSMFVVRTPVRWEGDLYITETPVLERIDPAGRAAWILDLPVPPDEPLSAELFVDAQGNALVALQRSELTASTVELMVVHPDGRVCETFDVACESGPEGEAFCPKNFEAAPDGSLYFVVGDEGDPTYAGPVRIGRVMGPE